MFGNRFIALFAAILFLAISIVALYRLIYWFPIIIAGQTVGQPVTFLLFVVFGSLAIIALKDLRKQE